MKFGKEFKTHLEDTIPEWRDKFLCYKPLKKLLKHLPSNNNNCNNDNTVNLHLNRIQHQFPNPQPLPPLSSSNTDLQSWFVRILNVELDKFNDFYVDKEEEFVIRFQELKERIVRLKEKSRQSELYTSECEFSEEMMEIRKDLVTIHGEMVLLKNYSSLNFAGLIKILKKYDKTTGGFLRLPFTQLVLHQPVFTTEPLTRLVHECEENLELLFPLQDEVIQSTPPPKHQSRQPEDNVGSAMLEEPSTLGDETVYLYRSTLAAMKAIKGLQKESSTSNPFSFSFLFTNQDADSSGAVTAENSAVNSPATLQNEEGIVHHMYDGMVDTGGLVTGGHQCIAGGGWWARHILTKDCGVIKNPLLSSTINPWHNLEVGKGVESSVQIIAWQSLDSSMQWNFGRAEA